MHMVNRVRPLLQNSISPRQSDFIPGCLITDNAIIAFECLHLINSNADDNNKVCVYKLDLSKAYDRVDCSFSKQCFVESGLSG